jgi:hypothetical protein
MPPLATTRPDGANAHVATHVERSGTTSCLVAPNAFHTISLPHCATDTRWCESVDQCSACTLPAWPSSARRGWRRTRSGAKEGERRATSRTGNGAHAETKNLRVKRESASAICDRARVKCATGGRAWRTYIDRLGIAKVADFAANLGNLFSQSDEALLGLAHCASVQNSASGGCNQSARAVRAEGTAAEARGALTAVSQSVCLFASKSF